MFILENKNQLANAISKALQIRPRVKFLDFGRYQVSGSKGFYTVICRKDSDGRKIVSCGCKASEKGLVCYHAASALSLHVGLARQRQTA